MVNNKARAQHQPPGRRLKVWGFRIALAAIVGQALLILFAPTDAAADAFLRILLFAIAFVAVVAREVGGNVANRSRSLSPRSLTDFTERMKKWACLPEGNQRQSVAVFSTSGTFESASLTEQIAKALGDAGWTINRHPVMYGQQFVVSGVGLLIADNDRALAISADFVSTLLSAGIAAQIVQQRRGGCEEMGKSAEEVAREPWCSSISVMVGDKP